MIVYTTLITHDLLIMSCFFVCVYVCVALYPDHPITLKNMGWPGYKAVCVCVHVSVYVCHCLESKVL